MLVRIRPACRPLAAALAAAVFTACATTNLPPISAGGAEFALLADEVALWEEARDEEEKLLATVAVYDDPLLEDYLAGVVTRLEPPGMAANPALDYRVHVVADTHLNAFAYPHGALYVHSGLLARLDNEDQLATVLGHEMSHVEYRHMLRHRRAAQNRAVALTVVAAAAAVAIAGEEAEAWREGDWGKAATIDVLGELFVGLGLQLAFLAAVNGYGRDLEIEADQGGFAKLQAAGYRAEEAPKMYETLLGAAGPAQGRATTFFFASHPRLTERVESARAWAVAQPVVAPPPAALDDEFHRRLRPVVRDNGVLHLDAGRFAEAELDLQRALEWLPGDPVTHYQLGRLRLAQSDSAADDAERLARRDEAVVAFREALRLDADYAEPHRQLGLLLYAAGDLGAACRSFGHYLELEPEAEDAGRMRDYRRELVAQGVCGAGEGAPAAVQAAESAGV